MTGLVPCIDCGQPISQTAHICPKCESRHPRGTYCGVCAPRKYEFWSELQPFPVSQALTKPGGYQHYHPECVQRVLKVPDSFACVDCGMPITKLWDWEKLFNSKDLDGPCPECGRPRLITEDFRDGAATVRQANCHSCELPMLVWHKRVFAKGHLYHDFCLALECAVVERHNRSLESKNTERNVLRAKSSGGCLSLLLIGMLIVFLVNSVRL